MNISIVGRRVELSDSIKEHISASIETLSKYNLDIISANAVANVNEKNKGFKIEFVIKIAGNNTIVITQPHDDLYAAVDLATNRAQKALRRLHDRQNNHYDNIPAPADSEPTIIEEDEIIPAEPVLFKPQEIGDILESLKSSNKVFEVFYDIDGKMRVMYKRNDGKFGLY